VSTTQLAVFVHLFVEVCSSVGFFLVPIEGIGSGCPLNVAAVFKTQSGIGHPCWSI